MPPSSPAGPRTYDVSPSADPSILTPVAEHDDLRDIVRAIVAKSDDTWQRLMSEVEIGTLAVPEALGGAGFGLREVGVVLEETGGALLAEPILSSAVVAVQALLTSADPDQSSWTRSHPDGRSPPWPGLPDRPHGRTRGRSMAPRRVGPAHPPRRDRRPPDRARLDRDRNRPLRGRPGPRGRLHPGSACSR